MMDPPSFTFTKESFKNTLILLKKGIHITLDIKKLPEGVYVATSRDIQGLVAQGKTFMETIEIAKDVARVLI